MVKGKDKIIKASGVIVHCKYDDLVDPAALRPHPENPNKHPPQQVSLLAELIGYYGWRWPVIVSRQSDFIVAGHCRVLSALEKAWDKVPVVYQNYSEDDELGFNMADNKIQEFSELDFTISADNTLKLDAKNFPLEMTSFPIPEIKRMMEWTPESPESLSQKIKNEKKYREEIESVKNIAEQVAEKIKLIRVKNLSKAIAIVIPKGQGRELFVLIDPSTKDVVAELKRYAKDGVESPLAELMASKVQL